MKHKGEQYKKCEILKEIVMLSKQVYSFIGHLRANSTKIRYFHLSSRVWTHQLKFLSTSLDRIALPWRRRNTMMAAAHLDFLHGDLSWKSHPGIALVRFWPRASHSSVIIHWNQRDFWAPARANSSYDWTLALQGPRLEFVSVGAKSQNCPCGYLFTNLYLSTYSNQ